VFWWVEWVGEGDELDVSCMVSFSMPWWESWRLSSEKMRRRRGSMGVLCAIVTWWIWYARTYGRIKLNFGDIWTGISFGEWLC
jgi:hypothetical protein